MATLLTKARNILPGNKNHSASPSPSDRSIPPEPVQQQPHGDFRAQEKKPALQVVNLARANKTSGGLSWDDHLADDAQAWAEELAANGAADGAALGTRKSEVQEQGEAIFVKDRSPSNSGKDDGEEPTYEDAISSWLSQETKYGGGPIPEDQSSIGEWASFTQVMWQKTHHIGMGKAKSDSGTWYIVARFTPRGNIPGETPF